MAFLLLSVALLCFAHDQRVDGLTKNSTGRCHEHSQPMKQKSTPSSLCCQAGHQNAIIETGSAGGDFTLIRLPVQLSQLPTPSIRSTPFAVSEVHHGDPPQRAPLRI